MSERNMEKELMELKQENKQLKQLIDDQHEELKQIKIKVEKMTNYFDSQSKKEVKKPPVKKEVNKPPVKKEVKKPPKKQYKIRQQLITKLNRFIKIYKGIIDVGSIRTEEQIVNSFNHELELYKQEVNDPENMKLLIQYGYTKEEIFEAIDNFKKLGINAIKNKRSYAQECKKK
jgi:hypothetical protein